MGDLPVLFFLLDSLFKKPRRGVFRLFFSPYTQFPLLDFLISFRFGFFCLIISSKTHDVGFPACFILATPSFRYETS